MAETQAQRLGAKPKTPARGSPERNVQNLLCMRRLIDRAALALISVRQLCVFDCDCHLNRNKN